MYKHLAESIKESSEKRFISQADRDKYNAYSFMRKEDTYNKQEIDVIARELDKTAITVSGTDRVTQPYSRTGFISSFEVCGNTIQSETDLTDIKHLGEEVGEGKYSIKVKTVGKNLFDMEALYNQIKHVVGVSRTERGIKIEIVDPNVYTCSLIRDLGPLKASIPLDPNKRYVLRGNMIMEGELNARVAFNYADGSDNSHYVIGNGEYYINSKIGCEINGFKIAWTTQHNGGSTIIEDVAVYEVEEEVTSYPEEYYKYEESVREIILDEPLRRVGNLSDKIAVENNEVKVIRNVGIHKLYEDFKYHSSCQDIGNTIKFCTLISDDVSTIIDFPKYAAISNFLPENGYSPDSDHEHIFVERRNNFQYTVIFVNKDKILGYDGESLNAKMKAYLKDVNAKVYYQLDKPITIDMVEISGLGSYKHSTFLVDSNIPANNVKCCFPVTTGDMLAESNEKILQLKNKVFDIKSNVVENGLKKEFTTEGISFENKSGLIDDIEIKGKTVFNIANLLENPIVGGGFANSSIVVNSGKGTCELMLYDDTFTLNGDSYVLFDGLDETKIKPSTNYKVTFTITNNYSFNYPTISFANMDCTIINSESKKTYKQTKLTYTIRTNDVITKGKFGLKLTFSSFSFKQHQRIFMKLFSVIETDEDVTIFDNNTNSTLLNASMGQIDITNQSSNLITFENIEKRLHNIYGDSTRDIYINNPDIEVEILSDNELIVRNTKTQQGVKDSFFIANIKTNSIKKLVHGKKYRLSWDYEILDNTIAQNTLYNTNAVHVYVLTTVGLNTITLGYRGLILNDRPLEKTYVDFEPDATVDNRNLFRINLNVAGAIRFYNIQITPIENTNSTFTEYKSNTVSIDLSKYGMEDGLKSLPDGTCDRIFKLNNKYCIEKKVGAYTIDGKCDFHLINNTNGRYLKYWVNTREYFAAGGDRINTYNSAGFAKTNNPEYDFAGSDNGTVYGGAHGRAAHRPGAAGHRRAGDRGGGVFASGASSAAAVRHGGGGHILGAGKRGGADRLLLFETH